MLVELQYCALYQESLENCILFVIRFNDYFDISLELSIIINPNVISYNLYLTHRHQFSYSCASVVILQW